MVNFYLSPSNFCFHQYRELLYGIMAFGWKPTHVWPVEAFKINTFLKSKALTQSVKAISRSDMFIAYVPGSSNAYFEVGLAYSLCEEIFLATKDPVHFTQTGLADSYIPSLTGIKRTCCKPAQIPLMLSKEYAYLIKS
jgi:hypothetical protein